MSRKNSEYQTKTITFNGAEHTLYSLDGQTWSSRKEELPAIVERHKEEADYFSSQIRGGAEAKEAREKRRKDRIQQADARRVQVEEAKQARIAKIKADLAAEKAKKKELAAKKPKKLIKAIGPKRKKLPLSKSKRAA